MIRRRPIPRSRSYPEVSQHYEVILNGAVRVYKDALGNVIREVCQDNPAGWREYKRRVEEMLIEQNFRCCLCGKRLALADATFDHQRRRGMGGSFRDDRKGNGGAAHWICNVKKG